VPADAEPDRGQAVEAGLVREKVQHRDPVGVELGRGRRGRAGQPRLLTCVVELQRDPGQLSPRIDLGHAHHEPVRRQPTRRP
jgi:hypothetical protein